MPPADLTRERLAERLAHAGLCVFGASLPLSVAWANAGWVICLAALVLGAKIRPSISLSTRDPLFLPWLLFLAAAAASVALGLSPRNGLPMLRTDSGKALIYFILTSTLAAYGSGASVVFYLVGAVAASLWGLAQATGIMTPQLPMAHASVHHVTYGELMSLATLFSLSELLFTEGRRAALAAAALTATGAALIFSQARAAWLASLVGVAIAASLRPLGKRWKTAIAGFICLAAIVAAASFLAGGGTAAPLSERLTSIVSREDNFVRLELWRVGARIIKDHPVFGVGLRNVKEVFPIYHPQPLMKQTDWGNLHNLYLHQTAERGIVGLAALLFLVWSTTSLSWKAFRRSPDALSLWGACALPAFWIMNLTETSLQHEIDAYTIAWILALATVPRRKAAHG